MTIRINNYEIKKADLIRDLTEKDPAKIKIAIELIKTDDKLCEIPMFKDHCAFTLKKIEEKIDRIVYKSSIDKIKVIIENHGLPKRGHLADHKERLMKVLESEKYSYLMGDPEIKKSYDFIVKYNPSNNQDHDEYEARLNHINGVFHNLQKERHTHSSRQKESTLVSTVKESN